MSIEATQWAWQISLPCSAQRLILLVLANRAGAEGFSYPSVARLEKETLLNRKTILKHLSELEEKGLISDTGHRRGKGTKVYFIHAVKTVEVASEFDESLTEKTPKLDKEPVPKTVQVDKKPVPKTVPQDDFAVPNLVYQNYQAVPIFPPCGTNFSDLRYQNWDTELKGTIKELFYSEQKTDAVPNFPAAQKTTITPQPKKPRSSQKLDLSNLPTGVSSEAAKAFIDHRRQIKAPISQRGLDLSMQEAAKAGSIGITPDQAIDEAILAGWKGIKIEWLANRLSNHQRITNAKQPVSSDPENTHWAENLGV